MQPPPIPAAAEAPLDDTGDDSFGFFSDDDAFLACVDMGEGDLGQPIDFEEGTGSSSTVSTAAEEEKAPVAAPQPEVKPQEDRYGPMGLGRTGQGTRPAGQQQRGAMNPPANPPPQQKAYVGSTPTWMVGGHSTAAATNVQPKPVSARPSDPGASSSAATSSRAPATANSRTGPANINQNPKPTSGAQATGAAPTFRNDNTASGSGATSAPPPAKRPATPSLGGFHFPPGMPNPLLQNTSRPPPAPQPQGVKRGADAMIGSSTRPSTGLGLSGAGGVGGGTRQPLGTLALDGQGAQQQQHQYQQGGSDAKG
ncbi:hypothetical protein C8R44DRAFT_296740 [Mycena epipterygia]|nr:hypothetical protein C8R44DRAFT_296740 [Mycena epipterygia]